MRYQERRLEQSRHALGGTALKVAIVGLIALAVFAWRSFSTVRVPMVFTFGNGGAAVRHLDVDYLRPSDGKVLHESAFRLTQAMPELREQVRLPAGAFAVTVTVELEGGATRRLTMRAEAAADRAVTIDLEPLLTARSD